MLQPAARLLHQEVHRLTGKSTGEADRRPLTPVPSNISEADAEDAARSNSSETANKKADDQRVEIKPSCC